MAGKNGSGGELKLAPRKVVEITFSSGVTVQVTPLNRVYIAGVTRKAAELFPAPDSKQYELALPEGAALDPSMKLPAEKNPDYRAAQLNVTIQRDVYIMNAVFETAVEFVGASKEALITHYADKVAKMREYADVLPSDDWQATLYACIAPDMDERRQVVNAAMDAAPLERGEVLEEVATFRLKVQGETPRELHRESPDIQPKIPGD